jgi:hypothetical protein
MKPAVPSTRMERWHQFVRWFFNSSPTAMIEPSVLPPVPKSAASRRDDARRAHPRHHERRRSQAKHRVTAH